MTTQGIAQAPVNNPYIRNPIGGGGGWWSAPNMNISPQKREAWVSRNYSPMFLAGLSDMYGRYGQNFENIPDFAAEWRTRQPQSLAELYKQGLGDLGSVEQEQYNQALSRLKGSYGGAKEDLLNTMAARRGGGGGALDVGMSELGRGYMGGAQDIATQQAMQSILNQENRLGNLMGFYGQDIGNEMGWLSGLTNAMGQGWGAQQEALGGQAGWLQSMIPYEQYNIEMPWQQAAQQASARLAGRTAEERINAQRRAEAMNNLGMLMGWQGQQAGQYGQGMGDWLQYQNMRGSGILGGFNPSWLNWTGY